MVVFMGCLLYFIFTYYLLQQFSKKYGSVFTVYFGPEKAVVLAGFKTVKQALVDHAEEFGGRYVSCVFDDIDQQHGNTQHCNLNIQ